MKKKSLFIYSAMLAIGGMSVITAAQAFNPMNPGSWFGGNNDDYDDYYYDRYYDRYGPYGYGPYGGWGGPYGGYGPYGYPGYGYGAPGYYPQQQQSSEPPPPPLPQ